MSVTSAVCDSRMTLPIMPKAPGSVNAAEPPKGRLYAGVTIYGLGYQTLISATR
jgi:hypothetical protein